MGANSRSTVGTATDAHAMLRIVFSRLGEPSAGPAFHYSFNTAGRRLPEAARAAARSPTSTWTSWSTSTSR